MSYDTRPLTPDPLPPPPPPGPDRIALLADDLRSLRTGLILVGLLSLLGTGLAVWSLLQDEDDDQGRNSLRDRVTQQDERLDEVEADVRRSSEESDVTALERRLETARRDAASARANASEAAEANDQLRTRVTDLVEANNELADRVEALEREGAGGDTGGAEAP